MLIEPTHNKFLAAKIRSISRKKTKKNQFDWLIGTWKNTGAANTYEEWIIDENMVPVGKGYKLEGGEKIISEDIRIIKNGEHFYYEAKLAFNENPILFEIVNISDCGFVCENYDYEFPKRISYELIGFDSLDTKLIGHHRSLKFTFQKVEEAK